METSIKYHPVANEFSVYIDTEFVGCGFSYYEAEEILENALYYRVKRQWTNVEISTIQAKLLEVYSAAMVNPAVDKPWQNALTKALGYLLNEHSVSYNTVTHELTVHSASRDKSYIVANVCQCEAYESGKACWHRAAARLVRRAMEK